MITFFNLEEMKEYARQQLEKTDYAVLPDVKIANKNEFIVYRSVIRQLIIDPNLGNCIPKEPKARWFNTQEEIDEQQPTTSGTEEI
jgi:hypothetical protein